MQACLLTTFVIVVLSTVGFVLAQYALWDVVRTTGIPADIAESAMKPGLTMLAHSFSLVGLLLVGFTAATAFLLASQVTNPLRALAAKIGGLKPGEKAQRTVTTGDEVEVLDSALADMAGRLAMVYAHQEEEIAARTADLRRQFELDRTILESIHLGVLTVDLEGKIVIGNAAAFTLLQGGDELKGRRIEDVLLLRGHRGTALTGEHTVLQCLRQNSVFRTAPSAHWSIERSDQSLLPITLSVVPLHEGGKAFGALVMFQNVTEERHLDYLKSEFITLASHQLRTPLSAIRWYAELLADSRATLATEQKEYVDEIDRSVRRMIALLGALLHAARMEDETTRPSLVSAMLSPLIEETVRDMEDLFEESDIRHKVLFPKAAIHVKTDPVLLRVVLQNLLSNAVKYSPKKTTVTIRIASNGATATVSVEDQGMGIPKGDQERIFEKFFRARNVKQMDTDGNGLGLAICQSIVDRMGGDLTFVSEEGKGTTFTVSLPVEKA